MTLRRDHFSSRSATLATVRKLENQRAGLAADRMRELALLNIRDTLEILKWNESMGIRLFRITSNFFPHMGNEPLFPLGRYYRGDMGFADRDLRELGEYARRHGHRLTFHMNPFVQLGSPNPDVLRRSRFDIMSYYNCIRTMGVDDSCIVLHIGGVYGDKRETMKRWLSNYNALPTAVRKLIVIENDERHYGAQDVLPFCEINKIPFCFDAFHNSISHARVEPDAHFLARVMRTWGARRPKFHLSEQEPGSVFGAHSKMVSHIPEYLLRLKNVDIMIEAKNKELAVMALLKRHFTHEVKNGRVAWQVSHPKHPKHAKQMKHTKQMN